MPQQVRQPRLAILPEVYSIGESIAREGGRPVLVGGWVRDRLLGIPHGKDFDLEVFGLSLSRVRRALSPFGAVHTVGRHFGVLKLATRAADYDVSVPRRESNIGKGHRGFWVRTDPRMTFEEAASRRDFTINSMGYAFLEDKLLDPYGGERDLTNRLLRHVGPAFGEDPLRVMRAMQFAGRFELDIVPETLALCRAQDLHELPQERIWEEIKKLLLQAPRPSLGFSYAQALGVLQYYPVLKALHDARSPLDESGRFRPWALTLAVVDSVALRRTGDTHHDLPLLVAALCHQMTPALINGAAAEPGDKPAPRALKGKPPVVRFLLRLTNSTDFIKSALTLIADLQTPQALFKRFAQPGGGEGAVRRLALRISIPYLLRLAEAYHEALHEKTLFAAGEWLEAEARRLGVWEHPPQPILKGRHLMERGLAAGPLMGELIHEAFEKQLDGEIRTLEDALAWLEGHPRVPSAPSEHRERP